MADFAIVCIHVMYREAQVRHVVAAEQVVAAAIYEDAVTSVTDNVVFDFGAG